MSIYHDPNQISAINPLYRDAFRSIIEGETSSYVTQEELDLKRTADTEPWRPSEMISKHVPNIDAITISLVTETTNLVDMNRKLEESVNVGLILMGTNVCQEERPLLIVLTTDDVFYAIEPNDIDRGIKFLKNQLEKRQSKVTFWTTDTIREVGCLKFQYDIDCCTQRVRCCTGLNRHLFKLLSRIPQQAAKDIGFYPDNVMQVARTQPFHRFDQFERLIDLWLGIHHEHIFYEQQKLAHLKIRPLNLTATNLILKRCVLVRRLAECLYYYARVELNVMNKRVSEALLDLPRGAEYAITEAVAQDKEHELVESLYFSHLSYSEENEER